MMKQSYRFLIPLCLLAAPLSVHAQEEQKDKVVVTGSIQSDVLIPQSDSKTGAQDYDEWALTNSYADAMLSSRYVDAGMRFEFLKHPLPGFESDFKGWGVPHLYVKGKLGKVEVTLGNYYEQFGSGFILRTYEERTLGIDNSLLGARVVARPFRGVTVKALTGRQRRYWKYNKAWVSGADVELGLENWCDALQKNGWNITLGASFVNKHETEDDVILADASHKLNLPENVNAWDARIRVQKGGVDILGEYAQKGQDPSFDNGYIYRKGYVAMLSGSYSRKGMSLLLQAKRSDNMAFRSRRTMSGTSSFINHLPAFTHDQTYALAALYPYATHPGGEWAYQAEMGYKFKRHTLLGGKYGTDLKVNYSFVHGIDQTPKVLETTGKSIGGDGYGSAFWKWGGPTYYQDLDIQLSKRLSKGIRMNLMYMNQLYNKTIVEGEGGIIHSNIFIADTRFNLAPKTILRTELQYLTTKQDEHDWAFALAELSLAPHWMFTISDQWNCGTTDLHYYQGLVTFTTGAHRLQAGYGRTRAGFNCSGGVCRYVPAQKGVTLSYNYNF